MGDDGVSSYVWERLLIFWREKLGLSCSVELENYQPKIVSTGPLQPWIFLDNLTNFLVKK